MRLYTNEVEIRSKTDPVEQGCIFTTRSVDPRIGYPRLQIPFRCVPEIYYDRCNNSSKGQLKVFLHQLAYRATGRLLPSYECNEDVLHICGRGRLKQDGLSVGSCFNKDHLAIGTHSMNMKAQNCIPITRCPCPCNHHFVTCTHEPRCLGTNSQEARLKSTLLVTSSE